MSRISVRRILIPALTVAILALTAASAFGYLNDGTYEEPTVGDADVYAQYLQGPLDCKHAATAAVQCRVDYSGVHLYYCVGGDYSNVFGGPPGVNDARTCKIGWSLRDVQSGAQRFQNCLEQFALSYNSNFWDQFDEHIWLGAVNFPDPLYPPHAPTCTRSSVEAP